MSLVAAGTIEIPDSVATAFDHGAFEPESRRVFIAHMARDRLEVVDADAHTLETRTVLDTGPRPNGVAFVSPLHIAVVACIGDETHKPQLQVLGLEGNRRWSIDLPGRPRWCVIDANAERVFLAIREPSMVLVARLPELNAVQHWSLPSGGAHGMDINHGADLLYVACDGGLLVEVDVQSGLLRHEWPLAGVPDATFFNPKSGLV